MANLCPDCRADLPDDARKCEACGFVLPCPSCGKALAEVVRSCPECGEVFEGVPEETEAGPRGPEEPEGPDTIGAGGGKPDEIGPGGGRAPKRERILGRFLVEEELGRGGMGIVYRVVDEELGKTLAVKVLSRALATDPVALGRIKKEVSIAQDLLHEGIVRVHQFYRAGGSAGFDMEFLDGETLDQHLAGKVPGSPFDGPVTVDRLPVVADLVEQLAAALDYVHGEGHVHRDVKPSNVMLLPRGDGGYRVKLLDFGIVWTGKGGTLTVGQQPGTIKYMPMEVLQGDQKPSPASDIFALGRMVYLMLTGAVPLHGIESDKPSSRVSGLPESLDGPVRACLGRHRLASAGALAAVLRGAVEEMEARPESELKQGLEKGDGAVRPGRPRKGGKGARPARAKDAKGEQEQEKEKEKEKEKEREKDKEGEKEKGGDEEDEGESNAGIEDDRPITGWILSLLVALGFGVGPWLAAAAWVVDGEPSRKIGLDALMAGAVAAAVQGLVVGFVSRWANPGWRWHTPLKHALVWGLLGCWGWFGMLYLVSAVRDTAMASPWTAIAASGAVVAALWLHFRWDSRRRVEGGTERLASLASWMPSLLAALVLNAVFWITMDGEAFGGGGWLFPDSSWREGIAESLMILGLCAGAIGLLTGVLYALPRRRVEPGVLLGFSVAWAVGVPTLWATIEEGFSYDGAGAFGPLVAGAVVLWIWSGPGLSSWNETCPPRRRSGQPRRLAATLIATLVAVFTLFTLVLLTAGVFDWKVEGPHEEWLGLAALLACAVPAAVAVRVQVSRLWLPRWGRVVVPSMAVATAVALGVYAAFNGGLEYEDEVLPGVAFPVMILGAALLTFLWIRAVATGVDLAKAAHVRRTLWRTSLAGALITTALGWVLLADVYWVVGEEYGAPDALVVAAMVLVACGVGLVVGAMAMRVRGRWFGGISVAFGIAYGATALVCGVSIQAGSSVASGCPALQPVLVLLYWLLRLRTPAGPWAQDALWRRVPHGSAMLALLVIWSVSLVVMLFEGGGADEHTYRMGVGAATGVVAAMVTILIARLWAVGPRGKALGRLAVTAVAGIAPAALYWPIAYGVLSPLGVPTAAAAIAAVVGCAGNVGMISLALGPLDKAIERVMAREA